MRRIHEGLVIGLILLSILVFWENAPASLSFRDSEGGFFTLEVLGYSGEDGFIAGPCPPEVDCTYECGGYIEMWFRLAYHGDEPINITQIVLWQTLSIQGYRWEAKSWNTIELPTESLHTGDTYSFWTRGIYTFTSCFSDDHGPFMAEITNSNNVVYEVVAETPTSIPRYTPSEKTLFPLLSFIISIGVLIINRRTKS